jgi:hypothetical protein
MPIQWYSINRDLVIEVHEEVLLNDALRIVDGYLAKAGTRYESGEEALAETFFGFCHSDAEFIEICIKGITEISYSFEVPKSTIFGFQGVFQHEEVLRSRDELIQKVHEFFTTPPQEIRQRLEDARKVRSKK